MPLFSLGWGSYWEAIVREIEVFFARVYITESSHSLKTILNYLENEAKIRGYTVFRAISGLGETGTHSTFPIDLSLNLPLVIEFFDAKEKMNIALNHLSETIKEGHIISWPAKEICRAD